MLRICGRKPLPCKFKMYLSVGADNSCQCPVHQLKNKNFQKFANFGFNFADFRRGGGRDHIRVHPVQGDLQH